LSEALARFLIGELVVSAFATVGGLVEVVGGTQTSTEAVQHAMAFYKSIGKKAILLNKELQGHVANRLQIALYAEVMYLIQQGVLSVADADDAVSYGPGLRWGVIGPSLQWLLGAT
jgi:carnitine 3-dehydrogenase